MGRDLVVCIAKHTWSNPCSIEREKYYYIDDGKITMLSNVKETSIKELAEILHSGIGISYPVGPQDNIIYEPQTDSETIFADGYFGRIPVPAYVYCYEQLKAKQIKELERHLVRLRSNDKKS